MNEDICDFCGSALTKPHWEHGCDDFTTLALFTGEDGNMHEVQMNYDGSWHACQACHHLVLQAAKDYSPDAISPAQQELALVGTNGALRHLGRPHDDSVRSTYEAVVAAAHSGFLQNRTGEVVQHP